MKVECIKKTVDLNKIHWAIDCFRANHEGKYPSYIIMSYSTIAVIINEHSFETVIRGSFDSWRKEKRLFNIPIAVNEGLKLGEVDIV